MSEIVASHSKFPADTLSKNELRGLLKTSDAQGWLALGTTWGLIAGAFALAAVFPGPVSWLISGMVIGGRQLALGILMHDCAHRSLFRTRALNDWVGAWLCASPTWQDLSRYRPHHLRHHTAAGTERDPDLALVSAYPATRESLFRKFLRDITGISFLRRVVGLLIMDAGYIEYTVAGENKPVADAGKRSVSQVLATLLRNFGPVVMTQLVLFAMLRQLGHAELFLLWVGAWAIPFSVFVRIRSIAEHAGTELTPAEHAGTELTPEPARHTRTTLANWAARLTVAPHHVNFHLEHHLLILVPQHNLPRLHRLLRERGYYTRTRGYLARGYIEVLRAMIKPA